MLCPLIRIIVIIKSLAGECCLWIWCCYWCNSIQSSVAVCDWQWQCLWCAHCSWWQQTRLLLFLNLFVLQFLVTDVSAAESVPCKKHWLQQSQPNWRNFRNSGPVQWKLSVLCVRGVSVVGRQCYHVCLADSYLYTDDWCDVWCVMIAAMSARSRLLYSVSC